MPWARSFLAALVLLVLGAGAARADTVDNLMRAMHSDADTKVRLSAAINLGRLKDKRAIEAFILALRDRDRGVRSVAAGALASLIDSSVDADVRARVRSVLGEAARSDPDSMVRDQAGRAYAALPADPRPAPVMPPGPGPGPAPVKVGKGSIYVEVGPMTDATKKWPKVLPIMRGHVVTSIGKIGPSLVTQWPGGKSPTDGDLRKVGAAAYYVDGSLTQLNVSKTPPSVSCSVSLLLATYPGKSMFAFLKGGAQVESGSSSETALMEATNACVEAVVDDMITTKLVPTMQQRAQ